MNELNTEGLKLKDNGKPIIKLYKKTSSIIGNMNVKGICLSVSELKVNSPIPEGKLSRKFMLALRQDGLNAGEYKITQISLTKKELALIRNSINQLLDHEDTLA